MLYLIYADLRIRAGRTLAVDQCIWGGGKEKSWVCDSFIARGEVKRSHRARLVES
jgi:hypothetical protein